MIGKDFIDRRGFLAGALRGALAGAACWLYGLPAAGAQKGLTLAHRASLDAVLDTLIPDDDYPGALRTGVPDRIVELLAGSPRRMRFYRRGLNAIERQARGSQGRSFHELPLAQRSEVLGDLQTGFSPGAIFFRSIRREAMTAFYSSPEAYAMLGYEAPVDGYPYSPALPSGKAAGSPDKADA